MRLRTLVFGLAAWEVAWFCLRRRERTKLYLAAKAAAAIHGKPLLVVGEPDGEYPCGDVTVDIRETSVCPVYVKTSVEDLSAFTDKAFGAAFASNVLEHVCDPQKAMAELHRVADEVFVAYPPLWTLTAWLVPGHHWLVTKKDDGSLRFTPWLWPCNVGTRYGTSLGSTGEGRTAIPLEVVL